MMKQGSLFIACLVHCWTGKIAESIIIAVIRTAGVTLHMESIKGFQKSASIF